MKSSLVVNLPPGLYNSQMQSTQIEEVADGQRGPVEHAVREQIIRAAAEHFTRYGYAKTTVADLAKTIGFSTAYIYKFFDSKQAIGQAICGSVLNSVTVAVNAATANARNSADKLRLFFKASIEASAALYFDDRKLFEIAELSSTAKWPSWTAYHAQMLATLRQILTEGRESGEFERKTPLEEAARAILQAMQPFLHPVMLQLNLDEIPETPTGVTNMILRSLSP